MTKQAKSHEEIVKSIFPDKMVSRNVADLVLITYRQAESEHLPVINQQAEEIEKLKAEVVEQQAIIEHQGKSILSDATKHLALQSRFDELVKSLENGLSKIVVHHDTCEDGWYSCPMSEEGCINPAQEGCTCGANKLMGQLDELKSLITKAKGQANGKV